MKKTITMLLAAAVFVPSFAFAPNPAFAQEDAWQNIHQDNQAIRQNTQNFYADKNAEAGAEMQEQSDIANGNLLGAIVDNQQVHQAKHDARVDAANAAAAEDAKHHDIHELHESEYDRMRHRQEEVDRERREEWKREADWNRDHDHDYHHGDWDHDHAHDHDHYDHDHDHDHDNWNH